MRYFTQELLRTSAIHRAMFSQIVAARNHWHVQEETLASFRNEAALLPRDAWRELDAITVRVMRDDEGDAFMRDLMPLAKPIDIGKTVALYRISSDAGAVVRSISGQAPVPVDKVIYDYRGHPIPIFATGYGREWREWNTLRSENFDALLDDQEAHVAKIRRDMALYTLRGDATINVKGYIGYGIENHPQTNQINVGPAGANIDLRTATADAIEAFINNTLGAAMDNDKVFGKVNWYVSPEIGRNLDKPYSLAGGFKTGSLRDVLLTNRRINKIETTFLLSGNEAFAFVPSSQYIRPLVGMGVSTVAITRLNPMDNYHFQVWGAQGLEIKADFNGASGVFFMKNTG